MKEKNEVNFKGYSKVQFLAAREKIESYRDKGYTKTFIWNQLKKDGVFGGSYSTFRYHYKRQITEKIVTPKKGNSTSHQNNASNGKEESLEDKPAIQETTASIGQKEPVRASTVKHENVFKRKISPVTDADKDSLY